VQPGRPTHGYDGPIKVSSGGCKLAIGEEFIDVGKIYHKRPYADDTNDLETCNAYSVRAPPSLSATINKICLSHGRSECVLADNSD
jgi:hypothetical protein